MRRPILGRGDGGEGTRLRLRISAAHSVSTRSLIRVLSMSREDRVEQAFRMGSMPASPRFSQYEMLRCWRYFVQGEEARDWRVALVSASSSSRSRWVSIGRVGSIVVREESVREIGRAHV